MRQAIVHKDTSGQWKYLRFILHAPKSRREYNAVEIALKIRARSGSGRMVAGSPIGE
jgi:hypothetical protein